MSKSWGDGEDCRMGPTDEEHNVPVGVLDLEERQGVSLNGRRRGEGREGEGREEGRKEGRKEGVGHPPP